VRRLSLLALLALGLAGCGGSGASQHTLKITLGRSGGTMVPYSVTIAPGGEVTIEGGVPGALAPMPITSSEDARLSGLVRNGLPKLNSEQCAGTFPDASGQFITALGKTVTVRGTCEPAFTSLWDALTNALGLNQ
jgi:hypothetical protein